MSLQSGEEIWNSKSRENLGMQSAKCGVRNGEGKLNLESQNRWSVRFRAPRSDLRVPRSGFQVPQSQFKDPRQTESTSASASEKSASANVQERISRFKEGVSRSKVGVGQLSNRLGTLPALDRVCDSWSWCCH